VIEGSGTNGTGSGMNVTRGLERQRGGGKSGTVRKRPIGHIFGPLAWEFRSLTDQAFRLKRTLGKRFAREVVKLRKKKGKSFVGPRTFPGSKSEKRN